jgi:hypothetical protein
VAIDLALVVVFLATVLLRMVVLSF